MTRKSRKAIEAEIESHNGACLRWDGEVVTVRLKTGTVLKMAFDHRSRDDAEYRRMVRQRMKRL
jgi:hypothetical protein